ESYRRGAEMMERQRLAALQKQAEARAAAEQQRASEAQRRAEADRQQAIAAAELKQRLAALPADAQKYLAENPGMSEPGFEVNAGPTMLTIQYTAELSFRVCRERFGGFDSSINEMKRRS